MLYFWILVVVLLCLVIYGFDQQSGLNPEAASPRKLIIGVIISCLRFARQLGRNVVHGVKADVTGWRSGDQLKKRAQQDPEQKD